jgi:hypothetical protein
MPPTDISESVDVAHVGSTGCRRPTSRSRHNDDLGNASFAGQTNIKDIIERCRAAAYGPPQNA